MAIGKFVKIIIGLLIMIHAQYGLRIKECIFEGGECGWTLKIRCVVKHIFFLIFMTGLKAKRQ